MEKNLFQKRLQRINEHLREGDFHSAVEEIRHWLENIRMGEIVFDLENLKVQYKRDKQDTVNTAITAKVEEKLKEIICPRIPLWMGPDHLTVIGVLGILMVCLGFIFGFMDRNYLVLVVLGLVVNWFGDSFDGSIARYRKKTRPNYGYYIDKIVDAVVIILFGLGLGLSGFVKIEIALLLVSVYLALMLNVDLIVYVDNQCKNSFGWFGPTEIRIIGIFATVFMYFLPVNYYEIYGYLGTQYDIGVFILSLIMFLILLVSIVTKGIELHKKDIKNW
jgi:phosphatidylglycerophosphate synthase